ncbi:hypothetical protein ACVMAJ_006923 [Bradyrhizobium sp. USDA 4448]
MREATVGQLAKHEAAINDAAGNVVAALAHFAAVTDPITPTIIDAQQINIVAKKLADEFPAAIDLVTAMIRVHVKNVRDGTAPATLIEPVVSRPKASPLRQPETQTLIAVRDLAWFEGSMLRRHPKGWPVSLPIELAQHAMALRAALAHGEREACAASTNPRRTRDLPDLSSCVTLDAESAKAKEEALERSGGKDETSPGSSTFQTVNRGPQLFGRATLN